MFHLCKQYKRLTVLCSDDFVLGLPSLENSLRWWNGLFGRIYSYFILCKSIFCTIGTRPTKILSHYSIYTAYTKSLLHFFSVVFFSLFLLLFLCFTVNFFFYYYYCFLLVCASCNEQAIVFSYTHFFLFVAKLKCFGSNEREFDTSFFFFFC